jgi:DegV family protein with EDD domain
MGWQLPEIISYLKSIRLFSNGMFTLNDLSYLINGGRISHIKGLVAAALQLKPIIKVDKGSGKYIDAGRGRTMKGAIHQIATLIMKMYGEGARLRIQLLHGDNLPAVDMLKEELTKVIDAVFDETLHIAPVLGAHTGPSMVGLSAGPLQLFTNPIREATAETLLDRLKLPGFNLPLLQESNL